MKRNRFGINLDERIPLSSKDDFQILYVPCFSHISDQLKDWIENYTDKHPLMFGGQIGSGKSTLIVKSFLESSRKPDITFHFDTEGLNLDVGDFLSITLAGFIKKSIEHNIDLSFSELPLELFKLSKNDWRGVIQLLCPEEFSLKSFDSKISARKKILEYSEYIKNIINKIGDQIEYKINSHLLILASGIDKYDTESAAFFSLHDSLKVLSQFKTLYEVNVTHFFLSKDIFHTDIRLFIPAFTQKDIVTILSKRMGVYTEPIKEELLLLK